MAFLQETLVVSDRSQYGGSLLIDPCLSGIAKPVLVQPPSVTDLPGCAAALTDSRFTRYVNFSSVSAVEVQVVHSGDAYHKRGNRTRLRPSSPFGGALPTDATSVGCDGRAPEWQIVCRVPGCVTLPPAAPTLLV